MATQISIMRYPADADEELGSEELGLTSPTQEVLGYVVQPPKEVLGELLPGFVFDSYKSMRFPIWQSGLRLEELPDGKGLDCRYIEYVLGNDAQDLRREGVFDAAKKQDVIAQLEQQIALARGQYTPQNIADYCEVFEVLGQPMTQEQFTKRYAPKAETLIMTGGLRIDGLDRVVD